MAVILTPFALAAVPVLLILLRGDQSLLPSTSLFLLQSVFITETKGILYKCKSDVPLLPNPI